MTEPPGAGSPGLSAGNFRQIAVNGFGEPENAYPHSMAWFKNHLFVGTTRHVLTMTEKSLGIHKRDPRMAVWPVRSPKDAYELDFRAQIWRYDVGTDHWDKVLVSPMERGSHGKLVPRSIGFRAMSAFPQEPHDRSSLYVVSTGGHHLPEAALFRSDDGLNFDIAAMPKLGDGSGVRSFRHFATFKGRLFTAPTAGVARGQGNIPAAMTVMVTEDPSRNTWELACEPSFGDRTNRSAYHMCVFHDHLYVGTLNVVEGFQVWKTDAAGNPPFKWKKVLAHGAYRGVLNQIAMTLHPFGDHLYVGSAIQNGGYDQDNRIGPAAIEVVRVRPDDSWDLVVGEPRQTPDGLKVPLSGFGPGFNNCLAGYTWEMCAHRGWLYVGTAVRTSFLRFAEWRKFPEIAKKVDLESLNAWLWSHGGCSLWRTRDGVSWIPVTLNGFGNPFNYGVRRMASTPAGLFVGLANPFGPELAVQRYAGWGYEANKLAGLEVWLGDHPEPEPESHAQPYELSGWSQDVDSDARSIETRQVSTVDDLVNEFYEHSAFHHVGLWPCNVSNPKAACENLMAELVAFLPERPSAVLDVGCGGGASTGYLTRRFPEATITGLTTRKRDTAKARETVPGARFSRGRFPTLSFDDETFDCVVCAEGPGRCGPVDKLLREVRRVLKPGGRLVFSDVLPTTRPKLSRWRQRGRARTRSLDAYRELVETTGFQIEWMEDLTSETVQPFHSYVSTFTEIKRLQAQSSGVLVEQGMEWLCDLMPPDGHYILCSAIRVPTADEEGE